DVADRDVQVGRTSFPPCGNGLGDARGATFEPPGTFDPSPGVFGIPGDQGPFTFEFELGGRPFQASASLQIGPELLVDLQQVADVVGRVVQDVRGEGTDQPVGEPVRFAQVDVEHAGVQSG